MAREHQNANETEGSCRWACLTTQADVDRQQDYNVREAQLSFDGQPHPVSPIVYAPRNASAVPIASPRISWLNRVPFEVALQSRPTSQHTRRPRTASTPQQVLHKSWYSQIPYYSPQRAGHPERQRARSGSCFSQDSYRDPRQSTNASFSNFKRPLASRSRPSIGAPTDFRRIADPVMKPTPVRQNSLRPLELSIYIESTSRLSPLPDFSADEWELTIPGLEKPPSALLRRETVDNSQLAGTSDGPRAPLSLLGRDVRREVMSEAFLLLSPENGPGPSIDHGVVEPELPLSDLATFYDSRAPTFPASQINGMAKTAGRSLNSRSVGYSTSDLQPQPSHFKHSRNQSSGRSSKNSFRRSKDDEAVEEAIHELNTIVEAKRMQAKMISLASPPLSPTSHIPAVAPAMTVRARSQTLSDIGSAFSTSLAAQRTAGSDLLTGTPDDSTRDGFSISHLGPTDKFTSLTSSSVVALPPNSTQRTLHGPKPRDFPSSMPIRTQPYRKDRLSMWLRRMSKTPADVTATTDTRVSNFEKIEGRLERQVRSSASLDTVTTRQSNESAYVAYSTPTTTAAPSSPLEPVARSSISKAPHDMRRTTTRGLSIDTTLSNRSRTVPPAYHELDPHPIMVMNGEVTPSRIGVAC